MSEKRDYLAPDESASASTDATGSGLYLPDDESPQGVTYIESLLEGANPDEGFYE